MFKAARPSFEPLGSSSRRHSWRALPLPGRGHCCPEGLLPPGTGFLGCPDRPLHHPRPLGLEARGPQASLESASLLTFSVPRSRILSLEKQLPAVAPVVFFLPQAGNSEVQGNHTEMSELGFPPPDSVWPLLSHSSGKSPTAAPGCYVGRSAPCPGPGLSWWRCNDHTWVQLSAWETPLPRGPASSSSFLRNPGQA